MQEVALRRFALGRPWKRVYFSTLAEESMQERGRKRPPAKCCISLELEARRPSRDQLPRNASTPQVAYNMGRFYHGIGLYGAAVNYYEDVRSRVSFFDAR